jgi:putative FmdB family regulatory protein
MPIYEYECEKCHKIIEAWQNMTEAPLTDCPQCDGSLHKLISTSSFQLKGGGWYADGYGNAKPTPSKSESSSAPKAAEKSTECSKKSSCPCAAAS